MFLSCHSKNIFSNIIISIRKKVNKYIFQIIQQRCFECDYWLFNSLFFLLENEYMWHYIE
jgi:TRAP-type mannitol/chloroaromatic compound transport system permease small subunit